MNKYCKYKWNILAVLLLLLGCDDFLKEDSGDLLIPERVDEFSPMLYAEGYPSGFNDEVTWFKLMTDDVEMERLEIDSTSTELDKKDGNAFDALEGGEGRQAYVWTKDLDDRLNDNFWGKRYENILACNLVIRELPEMHYVEQDSGKYNYLAAQAYALRAYHYWCLINTYALPYAEENMDKPGVIIRTNPEIEIKSRPRSSIREVYKLINEDMEKAEQYIVKSDIPGNKHLLTRPALYLLASRIALFQENWDEVIRTAELFLKDNSNVFDLNAVDTILFGTDSSPKAFCMMDGMVNEEIVFTFGNSSYDYDFLAVTLSGSAYGLGFRPSREGNSSLLRSYEEGDLRTQAYFKKNVPGKKAEWPWEEDVPIRYNYQYPVKYWRINGEGATKPNHKMYRENWRSVEVMLNLAEAYVRKTNSVHPDAIGLLDNLRQCRISNDKYVAKKASDFSSSEDLLHFIWSERRRELCFEEAMRFWDLRRQGMPEIEHRWYTSWNTYETYILRKGSPNYVLSIPESELKYNDACTDNSREMINAN